MLNKESLKRDLWVKKNLPFIWRGGVCGVGIFAESVFIVCPGSRDDEKLVKLKFQVKAT